MARPKRVTISKKVKRAARRGSFEIDQRGMLHKQPIETNKAPEKTEKQLKGDITIPQVVPVRKLAEILEESATSIVSKLFANGVQATINDSVDFDTAAIIADEYGFAANKESAEKKDSTDNKSKSKTKRISRPPVIAVMGHVDHGKTTLLDAIRKTNVVAGESGGITQHIGAYQVTADNKEDGKTVKRKLTFIDTPGHAAFSAMRAQGANVTDIVVLVVAADDGVKPQTLEAISHARSAGVPIIVAINKIDVAGANPERVKRELAEHNLVPEDWGGKTPMVEVSAKKGTNISTLIEVVLLTSDLEELTTNPKENASGIVIESKVKPGLGPVATILVKDGILKQGDNIIIGQQIGRVKTMEDYNGERVKLAGASMPVQISGFKKVTQVGDRLVSTNSEKDAKDEMSARQKLSTVKSAITSGLGEVSQAIKKGKIKELNLILRADVQGSLEAIKNSLTDIKSDEVSINFISAGVGSVTESDVNLAVTSTSIIIAFNVSVPPQVKKIADEYNVKISRYDVIYELIDEVKAALQGLLEPEIVESEVGKLKILKVFRRTQSDGIVGGLVTKGVLRPGLKFRAKRGDEELGDGTIKSLQIGPDNVDVAKQNDECGINFEGNFKFKPDDIIEAYQTEEILKTIK